jgi:hypothetical protein
MIRPTPAPTDVAYRGTTDNNSKKLEIPKKLETKTKARPGFSSRGRCDVVVTPSDMRASTA